MTMKPGNEAMKGALKEMFETGAFPDLTIKCGDKTFKVHKNILCLRSEYFAMACKSEGWKEGAEGVIVLKSSDEENEGGLGADDPFAVACMLKFVYTHDYQAPEDRCGGNKATSEEYGLALHVKLYALGDKYMIPSLKQAALDKFTDEVRDARFRRSLPEAIELVFSTTPANDRGLRDVVTQALLDYRHIFMHDPAVEKILERVNGLAYYLLKQTAKIGPHACPECGKAFTTKCAHYQCSKEILACGCGGEYPMCDAHLRA